MGVCACVGREAAEAGGARTKDEARRCGSKFAIRYAGCSSYVSFRFISCWTGPASVLACSGSLVVCLMHEIGVVRCVALDGCPANIVTTNVGRVALNGVCVCLASVCVWVCVFVCTMCGDFFSERSTAGRKRETALRDEIEACKAALAEGRAAQERAQDTASALAASRESDQVELQLQKDESALLRVHNAELKVGRLVGWLVRSFVRLAGWLVGLFVWLAGL